MSETRWEHFAHEADMGVRGFGESKAEAFEQAALAMTAVITDLEKLQPNEVRRAPSALHATAPAAVSAGIRPPNNGRAGS